MPTNRLNPRIFAPLLAAVALSACSASPSEVFEDIEKAASEGDAAGFAACFTEESRPFAEALMSLYMTQSAARGPVNGPLEVLAFSKVTKETVTGRRAYLDVKSPSGAVSTLVFELEDGDWKLDIAQTEKKNADGSFGE